MKKVFFAETVYGREVVDFVRVSQWEGDPRCDMQLAFTESHDILPLGSIARTALKPTVGVGHTGSARTQREKGES